MPKGEILGGEIAVYGRHAGCEDFGRSGPDAAELDEEFQPRVSQHHRAPHRERIAEQLRAGPQGRLTERHMAVEPEADKERQRERQRQRRNMGREHGKAQADKPMGDDVIIN